MQTRRGSVRWVLLADGRRAGEVHEVDFSGFPLGSALRVDDGPLYAFHGVANGVYLYRSTA